MARTRFSSPLLREECVSMQDPLFSPPYKNLNMETVIGNCLDNLKWFILGLCTAHRSKQRKHESYRVSVRKQTLSSSWHTHTGTNKNVKENKGKRGKGMREKACLSEFTLTDFFFDHTVPDIMLPATSLPPSKLPRINKECNVTQSHFWKQRRKISGEETLQMPVFSFSSPPILSFPPLPKDQFHCYSREQHLSQALPAQLSKRSIV